MEVRIIANMETFGEALKVVSNSGNTLSDVREY